jgi:hypothetical protein
MASILDIAVNTTHNPLFKLQHYFDVYDYHL